MADKARRLHQEWKRADDLAREAERQIAGEWEAFFEGNGDPPKEDALQLVRDMRTVASVRLTEFMEYMRSTTGQ